MSANHREIENALCAMIQIIVPILSNVTVNVLRTTQRRRGREWVRRWIRRRQSQGASNNLLRELAVEDGGAYRNHLRMTPQKFEELFEMVGQTLQRQNTVMRDAIPARTKLEITLRYLATGDSLASLQFLYRVPKSTISKFLPEVLKAVCDALESYIKIPMTTDQWKAVQQKFELYWNFPGCVGAMDGKHIRIHCPEHSGSDFFNYKGTFSIIVFALVDAEYNFLYIDVGANGKSNDAAVFQASTLNVALETGSLNLPSNSVFVADDAFPLRKDILKPYSKRNLTVSERVFNYRVSRARRVSENAFGILVSRFRVFERSISVVPQTADLIVRCACTLHNWLRKTSGSQYLPSSAVDSEDIENCQVVPGSWRVPYRDSAITRMARLFSSNAYKIEAKALRERYERYFMSREGSLPWQLRWVGSQPT